MLVHRIADFLESVSIFGRLTPEERRTFAALLHEAGFTRIEGEVCTVEPPPECQYWRSRSLLVPIVRI